MITVKKSSIISIQILLFLLSLILLPAPARADYNPLIRPDPRYDIFVQRINARYGLLPDGFYRQPMGSGDFLTYLDSVSTLPLTGQELYMLEGLRKHLSLDGGIYGFSGDDRGGYGVIVNLDLTADAWARTGGKIGTRMGSTAVISPHLRGYIGKLSFYSTLDIWTEYVYDSLFYPSDFQPYRGIPYTIHGERDTWGDGGNMRASNLPRAGISYDVGRLTLEAAIDYLRLGPAVHYPVTLSGTAPPVTYARAILDLTHMEYWHVAGVLRSQRDKAKYIYANGLRGSFWDKRLQWGVSEVMIAGSTTNQQDNDPENIMRPEYAGQEPGWEWAFLVPFVPMVFVEFYTGDMANAALAFDFSLNWPRDFRFYGEFYIDDLLSPFKMFSDDWGNKWAVTLGMQYFTNLYNRGVSAGLEWSRVEPWVYTHFYGGSHRYDHFDKCLGSPMGPNSMAIAANADMSVTDRGTIGLKLTSLSNNPTARGGHINHIFRDPGRVENPDSETKKFLGPGTVHYLRPGIYGRYDPLGMFRVNASIEFDVAQDKGSVHFMLDGGFRF
ncbi:MAG: hypothetical protein LBC70_10655 [Chitinispirillales bacterium]|jgi:hypothetical protein|nr:hypothetical protein [Chitinispirillales bacterium]